MEWIINKENKEKNKLESLELFFYKDKEMKEQLYINNEIRGNII